MDAKLPDPEIGCYQHRGEYGSVHNIALRFAYDGHAFHNGYARQPEGHTVEDALIAAAKSEGYVADSWVTGSRTDKGVSAAENVAKLSLVRPHLQGLVPALQAKLPAGLWVTAVAEVDSDWNPRHHAIRTYSYTAPKRGETMHAMVSAAAKFVGTHNMAGFARVEEHRDPQRTINSCAVADTGTAWQFTISSPGFLWNQVRRMVDAILAVGRGDLEEATIDSALASGQPNPKFGMAPPDGLLLEEVRYAPPLDWLVDAGSLDRRRLESGWQRNQVSVALYELLSASSSSPE